MLGGVTVPAPAGCLSSRWHKEERAEQAGDRKSERSGRDADASGKYEEGQEIFSTPVSRKIGYELVGIMCLLGIQCLFFVDFIYGLLPWLMGGFLAGAGVLAVIDSVLAGEYRRLDTKLSSSGVLMLVVGLAILVRGSGADGLIGVAWGIFGLIQGSESLNVAIYNLAGRKKWGMDMLQAAVQIGLALLLLVDPVTKLYPHMRILGLELLAMGFHIFREIRAAS